jgi:hypothetical protein
MNDMTPIQKSPLERFSAGEISRIDVARLTGEHLSFGKLLGQLHDARLPLPRYSRALNPAGMGLLREILDQNRNG